MANGKAHEENPLLRLLRSAGAQAGKQYTPEEMVEQMESLGYTITKSDPGAEARKAAEVKSLSVDRWNGGSRLRFGAVSDTQLGSQKQQLTFLNQVYDKFEKEGIDTVLHCGDLVDGDGRVYPGQEYDLFVHGYDRQLSYAVANYPRRSGIKTYVIGGNHDWSFHQRKGADILRSFARERDDVLYLGYAGAKLVLNGINIYLIHLKSGLTYARSYKIQKVIEQFAPKEKPDLLLAGDRHSWAHLPMYRNVNAWQMGCFQAQTDHEKRLGLYPEIGGLIIDVHYGTAGADKRDQKKPGHEGRQSVVEVGFRILPQYVPVENDW